VTSLENTKFDVTKSVTNVTPKFREKTSIGEGFEAKNVTRKMQFFLNVAVTQKRHKKGVTTAFFLGATFVTLCSMLKATSLVGN